MDAAARLFRDKGFLNTTLGDIAYQIGISKANIYNYFPNKKYLLYEVLSSFANNAVERARLIISKSSKSPKDKMYDLVRLHVEIETCEGSVLGGIAVFERRNLPIELLQKYDTIRREFEHILVDILEEAATARQIRQCNTKLMARLILGMINSVPHWFKNTGPLSPDALTNEIWKFITVGMVCEGELEVEGKKLPENNAKRGCKAKAAKKKTDFGQG